MVKAPKRYKTHTYTHTHTLSHKRQDFRKKKRFIEHEMYLMNSSTNFVRKFLILKRIERDVIKNV